MAHRTYPQNLPAGYAHEKINTARARAAGPFGRYIAAASAVASPGVPLEAWLGFISNGGEQEVTEANELGAFGIEGARIPALMVDPMVQRILGGPAHDWHDLRDQAAMGVVNVLHHAESAVARLPPALRPSGPSSPWNVALGIMDWSLPTNVASAVRRHPELASVAEDQRWNALYTAIARDAQQGAIDLSNDHDSEAYTALRTGQKIEVSRLMGSAFFGHSEPYSDEVLARAVVGLPTGGIPLPSPSSYGLPDPSLSWGAVIGIGVMAAAAIEFWRRRRS